MADYVILYSDVTGFVLGSWPKTTSENVATFAADGHLTIDGTKVINQIGDRTDLAAVVLTDPTDIDPASPLNTHEVNSTTSPTDADERTDSGRDDGSGYDFDNPVGG